MTNSPCLVVIVMLMALRGIYTEDNYNGHNTNLQSAFDQEYPVQLIANPQSSSVSDGDQVTLTCKYEVPPNLQNHVTVYWTVTNVRPRTNWGRWANESNILDVNVTDTTDCDIFQCQLCIHGRVRCINSNPFKINKNKDPKHVLYTGSSITFIIPANVFDKGTTFNHSSGRCMYEKDLLNGTWNKCTKSLYVPQHKFYIRIKENDTVYITLEDLSTFDSGKYKMDSLWSESLLVWGYKSNIIAEPIQPLYGGDLLLTCNYIFTYNVSVTEFRWFQITDKETILLDNTQETYSVGPLTQLDQGKTFRCRPLYDIIGFSPSPQYTVHIVKNPEQQGNLTVSDIDDEYVTIQWRPGIIARNGMVTIEHKTPSTDWSPFNLQRTGGSAGLTYTHQYNPRTLNDYRVKVIDIDGESSYSNVLSVFVEKKYLTVKVDNTAVVVSVAVGVVAVLIFIIIMIFICIRRKKKKDDRLVAVENIHRERQSNSSDESRSGGTFVSDPSLGETRGSDPTIGSSEPTYARNIESRATDVNLPRLNSDRRSSESRRVHFPHSD